MLYERMDGVGRDIYLPRDMYVVDSGLFDMIILALRSF